MPELPGLFVIGSSLTLAMHPYLKEMCAGRLSYMRKGEEGEEIARALADLDTPQGAAAGDSSMVLTYLGELAEASSFSPDYVLLSAGAHDLRRNVETGDYQVPLDAFAANVKQIVDWFVIRSIQLIWMRIGPLDEKLHNSRSRSFHRYEADVDAYNAAADVILERESIPVLEFPAFTRALGPMEEIVRDHVHFTEPVVRQQAAYVVGYVEGLAAATR